MRVQGSEQSNTQNLTSNALLPDYLEKGLDVVFVGAAPSVRAAETGHYYAGATNRFWLLLYQSGFTPRQLLAEEDITILEYGIGLTAVFPNKISTANHLLPTPTKEIREELLQKLKDCDPKFVCFNGKDVFQMAIGAICTDWGEQETKIGNSRVFVLHSSSSRADFWGKERLSLYQELYTLLKTTDL